MVGMGVGAAPLLRVVAEMQSSAARSLQHTRVLYVPGSGERTELDAFRSAGVGEVRAFDAAPALLERFRATLSESLMGTRLYVAGPESFIGLVMKLALEFDLNKDEIRAEECGTLARRIFCIHCRATTEEVRTNIVRCVGCARWLSGPRPLLAPPGGLHGRHGGCRSPGRAAAAQGGLPVSDAHQTIAVEVVAIEQVTPLIKHFKLAPARRRNSAGYFPAARTLSSSCRVRTASTRTRTPCWARPRSWTPMRSACGEWRNPAAVRTSCTIGWRSAAGWKSRIR